MITRTTPLVLAVIAGCGFLAYAAHAQQAPVPNYVLDDQHTSVVFAVNHFGFSYTYGMFGKYSGAFSYDRNNPTASQFQFTIDAASLDTKSVKRDEHLRGPDFFNVKQFPQITFRSKRVTAEGNTINIVGDLTLHGVTKEIVLPLTYMGEGPGPYGKQRLGFSGSFKVKRTDFGIKAFAPKVGDEVTLMVSFEGLKQ